MPHQEQFTKMISLWVFSHRENTHAGELKSHSKPHKIEVSFTIQRDFPWNFKFLRAIILLGTTPQNIIYVIYAYAVTQGAAVFNILFCFFLDKKTIFASYIDALYYSRDIMYHILQYRLCVHKLVLEVNVEAFTVNLG